MEKSNLEKFYKEKIVDILSSDLKISNRMDVPKLNKIVLNMGLGEARDNKNSFQQAIEELTLITGQKPVIRRSKKCMNFYR